MALTRTPEFITERMQHILRRDTLIIAHISLTLIIILDILKETEESWPLEWKMISLGMAVVNLLIGVTRLRGSWSVRNKPMVPIIAWTALICLALLTITDFGSAYIYMLLVPIFLASYYYGKKEIYAIYFISGIALVVAPLTQHYILGSEVGILNGVPLLSFYNLALNLIGFIAMVSISRLIIDTTQVGLEDKNAIHEAALAVGDQRDQLEKVVSSINDAIFGLSKEGVILFANASAHSIINTHTDPTGQLLANLTDLESRSGEPVDINKLLKRQSMKPIERPMVLRYSADDSIVVMVTIKAVSSRSSKRVGFVVVMRDITEQSTLQEDRRAYISLLSHEIRTPLAFLEGQLSNMQMQHKEDQDKGLIDSINMMHDQTINLTRVVNRLSQYVEVEHDKKSTPLEDTDIGLIAEGVVNEYAAAAKEKELQLTYDNKTKASTAKSSDVYVRQIVRILVDNAIKFTDKGKVSVMLEQVEGSLQVVVADTGSGISKHHQLTIFNSEKQGESYETRTKGGLGLSLYSASRLAAKVDGKLTVESELGAGTVFTLRIPQK